MQIDAKTIKKLRDRTGVSIMKCKEALTKTKGDVEKAIDELRKKGEKTALKKADRETREGAVVSYIHSNNKIGSIVTLLCETDFVAKNDDFLGLAKDIAMQITATDPQYISPDDIPEKDLEKERKIEMEALKEDKKPDDIKEKIVKGKIEKYKKEVSLLTQDFFKNPDKKVEEIIKESIAKLGENIKIGEFKRFSI